MYSCDAKKNSLAFVRFFGHTGPPERPARQVVPIWRVRDALLVIEVVVRVELLVPVRPGPRAEVPLAPALGCDDDGPAHRPPELRLVIARQHLHFGDRVDRRRRVDRAVRSGVHARHAVNRDVFLVFARPVDEQVADAVRPGASRPSLSSTTPGISRSMSR